MLGSIVDAGQVARRTVTQNCEFRFKSVLILRKDEIGNLRLLFCSLTKLGKRNERY
jgi:hypothetical protein